MQARPSTTRRPTTSRAVAAPVKPAPAPAKGEQPTTAKVQYVKRAPNNEELFTYLYEKPEGEDRWTNIEQSESAVPVTDLRTVSEKFTLEHNGFQFGELHVPDDINWDDDEDVSALCSSNGLQPFAFASLRGPCCLSTLYIRACNHKAVQLALLV